jgi:hypothetical protein
MELQNRLTAGLLTQLLAGQEPRCFWTPARVIQNDAFKGAHVDRDVIAATARTVYSGDVARRLDTGGYRFSFTRIVHDDISGVFVCGVAPSGYHDRRLTLLPEILQFSSGRMPNAANLHSLMELVLEADCELFSRALLFSSDQRRSFVLRHDVGVASSSLRSWARWPLERLFSMGRGSTITNPVTGEKALAIPFQAAPAERYVLIFVLRTSDPSQSDRDFLSVLESVGNASPPVRFGDGAGLYDRVDAASTPSAPRLFYYGRSKLRTRIAQVIERRGWELLDAGSYTDMLSALGSDFQVLLIDGSAAANGPTILRSLRHISASTPIVYFSNECDEETEFLADTCVSLDAPNDEMFSAIKSIVRELPKRRRDYLRALVEGMKPVLLSATSLQQLAAVISRSVVPQFADWCAVHLFDPSGELFRAEFPESAEPVLHQVPLTFLSGYAVMKRRVDEAFLAEICEDPAQRGRLSALQARSGAAIPLSDGGTLVGSLVALSIRRDLDEADFEGLALFADAASAAFGSLRVHAQSLGAANDAWTRVNAALYNIDVYRPYAGRDVAFRIGPADGRNVRIHAASARGGHLTATLDVTAHRLLFDATHFPPPFHVRGAGPVSVTTTDVHEHTAGEITLEEHSVALIFDLEFTRAIDTATIVDVVQRGLREGQSNPASSLAALSGERFAFVAISLR